jgi:hypothetical protein
MMTRRIETPRLGSGPLTALLRAAGPGALCAALVWQVACRGAAADAPEEHTRPANAALAPSAPSASGSASAAALPAARSNAAVTLAKYEETSPSPAADSPAGKPAQGEPVKGPVVTEEPFQAWLQAVSPVAAGGPATVEVVLVANPPYHCNPEYPHKFKLGAAPAGIAYPEATVKGMEVTPSRSVLKVPIQAQSAGKATVSGTLQFSVCNDERCLVEKKELSLNLEVK